MAEVYNDRIKSQIGRVSAKVKADNYFPVVGETITINAETIWGQSSQWQTQNGDGSSTTAAGHLTLQKDTKEITMSAAGEFQQKFIARNYLTETVVSKMIYAMLPQVLPYFEVVVEKEVVRVGETGTILIRAANGYQSSRIRTIQARIYKENTNSNPLKVLNLDIARPVGEGFSDGFTFTEASDRGIYDVEVDVTDTVSHITFTKRLNKQITVTPKLCPKPTDTNMGYEVMNRYKSQTSYSDGIELDFELRLWRNVDASRLNYAELIVPHGDADNSKYESINVSELPAGTTLCLKTDPLEPDAYPMRFFVQGNKQHTLGSDNGTPNFTSEAPLIITHDQTSVWEWGWRSYGAFVVGWNMRNIVVDGYGYNHTGIHFFPFDSGYFVDSCLYVNNGSSFFELFGLDVDGAGFAGITAKTDPGENSPWYWRESGWEMYLKIHHCKFRNTVGEGCYIGYFDTNEKKGTNSSGQEVTYHAHIVRDLRLYRCEFSLNGFDSVQINNCCGVEFCYNVLDGCGYRREPNQGSAFSASMDGKVYNCIVKNNYNMIGAFGPFMGTLEVFNCVLTAAKQEPGWIAVAWQSGGSPAVIRDKTYHIHNNVVKAATIAKLTGDVTFENFTMNDNVFITEDGDTGLPGYFTGSGNVFLKADQDYAAIDGALKVADSANYDYQPAYNSQVVAAGKNGWSPFDMRGYKNWYVGNYHAGPFMGIYKDTSVLDAELALTGVQVKGGASFSYEQEVDVSLIYAGTPTKYRIGETEDLSVVTWMNLTESIRYTLSSGYGVKTVYAQVGSSNQESEIKFSSIEYKKQPVTAAMTVNGGKGLTTSATIPVAFAVTGVYESLQYMLSEYVNFTGASWAEYTPGSDVEFTLSGKGIKTVYGRIRSDDGQVIDMQGDVEYSSNKCIISFFNWGGNAGFDDANSIHKVKVQTTPYQVLDIAKNNYCKIMTPASIYLYMSTMQGNNTGDNSGVYPDEYVSSCSISRKLRCDYSSALDIVLSELSPGTYTVNLLGNGKTAGANKITSAVQAYYRVNGEEALAVDKGVESLEDNFTDVMVFKNVVVDASGEIRIAVYGADAVKYAYTPLNIIEIEKAL